AVLLITSVASGIYPSLYISKFQVVGILKGSVKFGQKNPVTKIFMTLQLILACIFVTGSVMFTQNRYYMAQRSWGYNQDDALYARVPDYASYQKLHDAMAQDANVLSISGSTHHVGKSHSSTVLHFPDREYEVDQLSVDAKYFETMGLPLKAGRFFHDHAGSDKRAVVVNELMVGNMGWTNAIGQVFKIDSIEYEVVGVVKDFHSYSFAKTVAPTIFKVAEQNDYRFLSLQVRHGAEIKTFEKLQAKWAELFPEIPFDGGHQEDVWGNYFVTIGIYGVVWRVIALIAISLASLGLYGLIKLNVEGRTKEFSIRKVLGAGLKNIVSNVSSQYVALLIVALVIGAPVSYFLIGFVVSTASAYHMPIDFSGTLIAVAILILVFLFTITTQVRTVLKTNPVNGLKVE
ncbi:MAG: ABC transporter permease, partial [Bacteroidota bacterium]